jgi:hypothetical protein
VDHSRNNQLEHRFRARQQRPAEDVVQSLIDMGFERECAEIAVENIEIPDQNLAMEWIDSNRSLVEEMMMMRVIEKTSDHSKEERSDKIIEASMDKFKREVTGSSLRTWIKFIYKELFQSGQPSEVSVRIKDVLFLCMDYLEDSARFKQYTNFNEKVYKDLDDLNKEVSIATKLTLLISIMETLAEKIPKARSLFYDKSIHMKVLSFLERVGKDEQDRIFSLLNSYLPIITMETLTAEFEEYLAYLLDLIHRFKPTGKHTFQILYKIAKIGKQGLLEQIKRNVADNLMQGLAQENIVPLLTIIIESDRTLSLTNAELDLKTFLYERYKHRINAFHPDKEHILEIDIKEFTASFPKYEKDGPINEACKRLLTKKKNKNKYFYYDCRKEENAFGYSVFAGMNFVSYPLKEYQKTVIRALIANLYRCPVEQQDELLTQIHKILSYFRIMLPFALREIVDGRNLL